MKPVAAAFLSALLLAASPTALAAAAPAPLEGTVAQSGLLPVHVEAKGGRILLSLPAPDRDGISGRYLYVTALKTGLGAAPVGLDRALSGGSKLVVFRRIGKKIAIEVENPRFRATNAPAPEQQAARDSFAYSTLWMGDAIDGADGRQLVDLSPFLALDTLGIAPALKGAGEKGFALSKDLTVADPASVKVFPENIEMEARQTFVSAEPGAEVNNIAPASGNLSFVVRHSLVKLPDAGYRPRRFDPRGGSFATQVLDYAAPLGQPIVYELSNRFRLEKTDPAAPKSRVKKPIVFYIDRSAPEPIRTALYEGASWWKQAFEGAGYIDAYRVEILPEGIDPLDIRYNVVNWVNRATRGWSYGQVVEDPRTGEIVKGQVLLGSLRVRQDMLIFEGLVGADKVGTGGPNDPIQASLARLRQLAAHEVGHALGLAHNFAASTQGRYSVMDYPAPRVGLVDGVPDLADAYGVGMGRWDIYAVDWLYGAANDAEAQAKAAAAVAEGLRYAADNDARPVGTAQPWGGLWDDHADPAAELERMTAVRRAAVDRFGLGALAANEPVANLRRKFVPIWLLHRYQVEGAAKLVGGVDFSYALRGDGREASPAVPEASQRRALEALLATLAPEQLEVPGHLLPYLSSGWSGSNDRQFDIEIFRTAGGPVFDPLVASEVAATVTLNALLAPERLNRLAEQNRVDDAQLGAAELIDRVIANTFATAGDSGRESVRRRLATTTALALARVQRDPALSPTLALALDERLRRLGASLAKRSGNEAERDWSRGLARLLGDREALDKLLAEPKRVPAVPPGMPIGAADEGWFGL
ncbi:zinc-dependent metalloprotease [Sphingosinicella sp. LY1275]|uniref:zinc-dependent metalloprotease n=1 Tax=Sphingosinicella sp. LY1275 TaxID=3095379 RepID=UPI002ADEB2E3|nr:zinc-dependent metalloprotease [Sphingosinicella sp. LY1275]MEA1013832.1 zinc-dependent metalloprotease [Sphingosinicella sp. LY1275]